MNDNFHVAQEGKTNLTKLIGRVSICRVYIFDTISLYGVNGVSHEANIVFVWKLNDNSGAFSSMIKIKTQPIPFHFLYLSENYLFLSSIWSISCGLSHPPFPFVASASLVKISLVSLPFVYIQLLYNTRTWQIDPCRNRHKIDPI